MHLLIWCGPVTAANLKTAELPIGARVVVINQGVGAAGKATGGQPIGSSHFAALGAQHGGSLRSLLASKGIKLDDCRTVTLAGFSAAHGLIESLLRGPEAGRVDVLLAADAYYTSPGFELKRGYRAHVERAAQGQALAILTASGTAGPTYPSGADAIRKSGLFAGLDAGPATLPPGIPEADAVQRAGAAMFCDYGRRYAHGQHATKLAPLFVTHLVTPFLNRGGAPPNDTSDPAALAALAALGLAVFA